MRLGAEIGLAGAAPGCAAIAAAHPSMARFAPPPRIPRAGLSYWLTNLGANWAPACPHASAEEADWETLAAVAGGIGGKWTLSAANVIAGPLEWARGGPLDEACARPPQPGEAYFPARFPAAGYLASGVILQRLTSGSVNAVVTEQCRTERDPVPEGVTQALATFGAKTPERWILVPVSQRVVGERVLTLKPAEVMEKYRNGMADLAARLALPHRMPSGQDLLAAPRAPLKSARKVLVKVFGESGWRAPSPQPPRGSHLLEKGTPGGRRLLLEFDTGQMLRCLVTMLTLVTKEGAYRLPAPASEFNVAQQLTPNPEIFQMAVENTKILVDYLETTWVVEMEAALSAG
jgi:hypothetical protein